LNIEVAFNNTSEDEDCGGRRAEGGDDHELYDHRHGYFERMETGAGGDVEIEIGVVHAMQAPQNRHGVEHDVLKVDREIEHEDGDNDRRPGRQTKPWNEADAMPFKRERKADSRSWKQDSNQTCVEEAHAQVARPAYPTVDRSCAARKKGFEQSKERQHA